MTSTVPPGRDSLHRYPGTSCLNLFSVAVCGPKGQDNLAQGLPWVNFPNRMGPHKALRRCALEKNTRFPGWRPLPHGEDWSPIQTVPSY
jgi:hypothetical protein